MREHKYRFWSPWAESAMDAGARRERDSLQIAAVLKIVEEMRKEFPMERLRIMMITTSLIIKTMIQLT